MLFLRFNKSVLVSFITECDVLLARGAGSKTIVEKPVPGTALSVTSYIHQGRRACGTVCPGRKQHSPSSLLSMISPQASICPKQCGYQETQRHCIPHGHLTDIKWGAGRIVGSVFISFGISAGRTPGFLVSLFSTLHKLQRVFLGADGVAFASLQAAVALWCEW